MTSSVTDFSGGRIFKAEKGDTVYAIADGVVFAVIDSVKCKDDGSFIMVFPFNSYTVSMVIPPGACKELNGPVVLMSHTLANGTKMLATYVWLESIAVSDSQQVKRGQPIGVASGDFHLAGFVGNQYPITDAGDTSVMIPTYGFKDPSTWDTAASAYLRYDLFDFDSMKYAEKGFILHDTSCFKLSGPQSDSAKLNASFLVFSMKLARGAGSAPTGYFVDGSYVRDGRVFLEYHNGSVGDPLPIELVNQEYSYNQGIFNPDGYNVFRVQIPDLGVKSFSLVLDNPDGYVINVDWLKIHKRKNLKEPVFAEKSIVCENVSRQENFSKASSFRDCKAVQCTIAYDTGDGDSGCILAVPGKNLGISYSGAIVGQLGCDSLLGFSIDVKTDSSAVAAVVRIKSSANKGWSKSFCIGSLKPEKWNGIFVPISVNWSDSQAIANGWEEEAPYNVVSFKEALKNVESLEIYPVVISGTYPKSAKFKIDNLYLCYDSSCFYSAFTRVCPTQLDIVSMNEQELKLSWQPVFGAQGYNVYRFIAGEDSVLLGYTANTFYVVSPNLSQAVYKVSAITQDGTIESSLSREFEFQYEDSAQKWIPYTSLLGTTSREYISYSDSNMNWSGFMHVLKGDMNRGFKLSVNGQTNLHETHSAVDYWIQTSDSLKLYFYLKTNRGNFWLVISDQYAEHSISGEYMKCPIGRESVDGVLRNGGFEFQELLDHISRKVAINTKTAPVFYQFQELLNVCLRTSGTIKMSNMDFESPEIVYMRTNKYTSYFSDSSSFSEYIGDWQINGSPGASIEQSSAYVGQGLERVLKLNPVAGISGNSFEYKFPSYNTDEFVGEALIKTAGNFQWFWKVLTNRGLAYVTSDTRTWNEKKITSYDNIRYIRSGIGGRTLDNNWHNLSFQLQEDIDSVRSKMKIFDTVPKEKILAVLGVVIRTDSAMEIGSLWLMENESSLERETVDYVLNFSENVREEWVVHSGKSTGTQISREHVLYQTYQWGTKIVSRGLDSTCFRIPLQRPDRINLNSTVAFQTDDDFKLFYEVLTRAGNIRYLSYDTRMEKVGVRWMTSSGNAIYGIGQDSLDGSYHTMNFDLQSDLDEVCRGTGIPAEEIVSVRNILFRTAGQMIFFKLDLHQEAN